MHFVTTGGPMPQCGTNVYERGEKEKMSDIIRELEKAGRLTPGGCIVEPTSGNTGVGLSYIAALRGYRRLAQSRNRRFTHPR